MSQSIESRVVEMIFDNSRFQQNVQSSLQSLDQLDNKLKLTDSAKGLENVAKASRQFDISSVVGAVETVSRRFSALEVAAITAIANITNSVINLGKQMARSLTIEPIYQGFSEYELKMNSVQTIMASTGADIETVTGYLENLNEYADKTIYSFSDMTSNIGKFTNAGVDLDSAVKAIKGISNEAAVSGANANEASRAMYNFAQALSAGSVKLIDWKSIENANMATIEFKQSLLDTAVAMGTVVKDGDKYVTTTTDLQGKVSQAFDATYAFNNSLAHQWMTTDVLIQTLGNYSTDIREMTEEERKAYREKLATIGYTEEQIDSIEKLGQKAADSAQDVKTFTQLMDTLKESVGSGWAQTFEIIFGNLEQAKELWTSVAKEAEKIFVDPINARNEMLRDALGDRKMTTQFWSSLVKSGDATKAFRKELKKTAREHGIAVDEMVAEHDSFTQSLTEGWLTGTIFRETLDRISESELESEGYTKEEIKALKDLAKSADDASTPLGKVAESLSLTGRDLLFGSARNIFNGMMEVASSVGEAFRDIFPETTANQLYNFLGKINEATSKFEQIADGASDKLYRTFKGLFAVFDIFGQAASAVIKNVFPPFRDGIGSFLGSFLDMSASLGDWLVNLDSSLKEMDFFNNKIKNGGTIIADFLKKISDRLSFIDLEKVRSNLESIGGSILERTKQRLSSLLGIIDKIKNAIASIRDFLDRTHITKGLLTTLKSAAKLIGAIGQALLILSKNALGQLGRALENADFHTLFDLLNSILLAGIGSTIIKSLTNFGKTFKGITSIVGNAKSIIEGVKDALLGAQKQLDPTILMEIAKAIALLAGSLFVISIIDSDKLTISLGAIGAMMAEISGAVVVLNRALSTASSGSNVFSGLIGSLSDTLGALQQNIRAGLIVKIAEGVLILAFALSIISGIEEDKLMGAVGAISALMAELTAASVVMSKFGTGKNAKGFGGTLVAFALSIMVMAKALDSLAKIPADNLDNALMSLTVISALLTEMTGILAVASKGSKMKGVGGSVIAASASIFIMVKALEEIAKIPPSDLERSLTTITILGSIMTALGVVMAIMGKTKGSFSAGLGMIEAAASIMIMAKALEQIGKLEADNFEQGITGIGTALFGMAIALNAMKGTQSGAASMIIASVALNMLVTPLKELGGMSVESIGKALITLAGTFLALSVAGAALSGLSGTLLAVSAAIVIFGIGIASIGAGLTLIGVGLTTIAVGITSLAVAMATGVGGIVLGIKTIIIGIAGIVPELIKTIGDVIVAFCQAVINSAPAIGEAIKTVVLTALDVISELVPQIVDTTLLTLIEVLNQLVTHVPELVSLILTLLTTVVDEIAAHIPEIVKSVSGLISAIFGEIFDELGRLNSDEIQNAIFGVGLFAGMMVALAGLAAVAPGALAGVIALGGVITELAAVMAAVGALGQIPGLQWLVDEGGDFAEKIGAAVGKFVGGIVGGAVEGATSTLSSVGKNLSDFATSAAPFFEKMQGLGDGTFNNISSLATALLSLTASNVIDGIAGWLTGSSSISKFAEDLPKLAEALTSYADSLGGSLSDTSKIESSTNLVSMLAALASQDIPKTGGVLQFLAGESGLSTFSEGLPELGAALTSYADSLGASISNTSKITASENLAKMLGSLANNDIPKSGGVLQWLEGQSNIGEFASQLPQLGAALTAYANSLGDNFTADKITSSVNAAKMLSTLQEMVSGQNNGGKFTTGDLTQFGENIKQFGAKVGEFYTSIQAVDVSKMGSITSSLSSMTAVASEMSKIDPSRVSSLASAFTKLGDVSLDAFANSLGNAASKATSQAAKLVDNVANEITSGGTRIKAAANFLMSTAVAGLESKTSEASASGKALSSAIVTSFSSGVETLKPKAVAALSSTLSAVSAMSNSFRESGSKLIKALADGLGSKDISKDIKTKVSNAKDAARSYRSNFHDAGSYLVQGFANGISSSTWMAEARAREMARKAADAAKQALNERSPSKVFYEIGAFAGQGFINALHDYSSKSYESGYYMADKARVGLSKSMHLISDLIEEGINANPTITPVLDLSQIQNGARSIDNLLGFTPSIAVAGNLSSISSSFSTGSTATNDDVVRAINKLNKAIAEMPRESTTINGVTYDDGSNINNAVRQLVRAARIERRA